MISMAGRCLAISSQQKRVIEVEYWRVCSEKRRHKDPLVYDSQAGRKAPPVRAAGTEQLWRHVFQPLLAILGLGTPSDRLTILF